MAGRGENFADVAWSWCTSLDNSRRRVRCNFCGKEMSGGITRLKHHLAGTRREVAACRGSAEYPLPDGVKWQCLQMIESLNTRRQDREEAGYFDIEDEEDMPSSSHARPGRPPLPREIHLSGGLGAVGGSAESPFADPRGKRVVEDELPSSSRRARRGGMRGRTPSLSPTRGGGIRHFFPPSTTPGSQPGIRSAMATDEMKKEVDYSVGRFFYDACIPFNAANSFHFQAMADAIGTIGAGYKIPSYKQLRGSILDHTLAEVRQYCGTLRESWKETGCTLMADGWTDRRGRTLLNFLVYCPMGLMFLKSLDLSDERHTAEVLKEEFAKVVEEVGPSNIVHFVTDNAANFKAAAMEVADFYGSFYWTPCAAHCLDLILEDVGKLDEVKAALDCCKDLTKFIYNHAYILCMMRRYTGGAEILRTAATRFATAFLCVQSVVKQKVALKQMFNSEEWHDYVNLPQNRRNRKLGELSDMVFRSSFWNECIRLLKITCPLVKVLRLADSEEKPSMGYLYEAMDRAKEAIKTNFNGRKRNYIPIWRIIDNRWNNQLHQHIHAAAYYLNPQFRYSATFRKDGEVTRGFIHTVDRLVRDTARVDAIHKETDTYDHALHAMGMATAIRNRTLMRPDIWWTKFGIDCPNLQDFAIRILSQTCSASGCERNWSVFENIHTKKRNRLEHKRLNDLVYIRCNMRLRERQIRRNASSSSSRGSSTGQFDPISLDNLDVLEDWLEEEEVQEHDPLFTEEDIQWINLESTSAVYNREDEDVDFGEGDEEDLGGEEDDLDYYDE